MSRPVKPISNQEKRFAKLIVEGVGPVEAARTVFKWKCEPHSSEAQKARDLVRSTRIQQAIGELKEIDKRQAAAREIVESTNTEMWSDIRSFAFDRLVEIRDSGEASSATKHRAILALEKLKDPSRDINLIFRWIDIMWRFYTAHCPCCHADFPLWKIKNKALVKWQKDNNVEPSQEIEDSLKRRLDLLERARPAQPPHPGQIPLIAAEERHIVGTGPARTGKSTSLAMFGFMLLMIPGAEVWLLSQTYEMSINEFQYIETYLKTLFHPIGRHIVHVSYDKKTDEGRIETAWGSALVTKSGHAKASITGREIEAALVAEPAWVDADLYEEVRARLSSRLGRIIALGTPKGFGGFLVRMVKQSGRSAGGKKLDPSHRLIANGCPWGKSLLLHHLKPEDNPAYVVSELEAAKEELTEAEFKSEFGGEIFAAEGSKFPYVKPEHLVKVEYDTVRTCHFVQGIDQGERNFGGCTLGWDGTNVFVLNEFFDNSEKTIKANMMLLNDQLPYLIRRIGGEEHNWKLSIFDADPPVFGILNELKIEQKEWKTEYTFRPKNKTGTENWRAETCSWINELARQGRLWFSLDCDLLHEQFMDVLNRPEKVGSEAGASNSNKGWIVHHWRKDHVLDAALLAFWTIYSGEMLPPTSEQRRLEHKPFEEERRAFQLKIAMANKADMSGFGEDTGKSYSNMFKETFGREITGQSWDFLDGQGGYYDNES